MKTDLLQQLERARPLLRPDWTPEREESVRRKMAVTRRKRRVRRAALALVAVVALTGAVALRWRTTRDAPPADFAIRTVNPETRWSRGPVQPGLESVALEKGGAWFNVEHKPSRVFRVSAGDIDVEVLGTRFLVEHIGPRVHVFVDHGRVRVRWPRGTRELTDGESGWFPPPPRPPALEPSPPPAPVSEPEPEPALAPAPRPEPAPAPKPVALVAPALPPVESHPTPPPPEPLPEPAESWQRFAQEGDFDRAWGLLERERLALRDDPTELLLAADVARLSRHPDMALSPLSQVLDRHPDDPRAPLAAFTLGRVLLEELGRPREAAAAFARARSLSPTAPLAEDALAREVEACSRAGDTVQARKLAEDFARLYPAGQRLRAVRHFGGIE